MSKEVYVVENTFGNSYELIKKLLTLYSVSINLEKGKNYLRPKLIDVLAFYLLKGYSSETKSLILDSNPSMKKTNLNQINSELQKKKLLVRDKYKYHQRHVSENLLQLKKYAEVSASNNPIFLVQFKLKNS